MCDENEEDIEEKDNDDDDDDACLPSAAIYDETCCENT